MMAQKILYQSPPINLDSLTDIFDQDIEKKKEKKTIDVSKLKHSKKEELTFTKPIKRKDNNKRVGLSKDQKSIIKLIKSDPVISNVTTVRHGGHYLCCNLCWGQYMLLEFQASIRTIRKRITVRICRSCLGNMNRMLSLFEKAADSSGKIDGAVNSRDLAEAHRLEMYGINPHQIQQDMLCDF